MLAGAQKLPPAVNAVDHLLLGIADLDRGIGWVEQRTGIRAAPGGSHPGAGTRNALLSLGGKHYLEIIAPDPAQTTYNFRVDVRSLTEPRLINFAVATNDIDSVAAMARKAGYEVYGPAPGSRRQLSGKMLRWKSLGVLNQLGSGGVEPMPFFIQWDPDSAHPSQTAPSGCVLESLVFEHPDETALAAAFHTFGIEGKVRHGSRARIVAGLNTPKGALELI